MNVKKKMILPYLNNAPVILITLGINLLLMFTLNWGRTFGLEDVLLDALICGIVTAMINVFVVHYYLKKALKNQTLPANMPVSRLIMYLPKNPALLAILLALFFGSLTPLINGLIFKFYDFEQLLFGQMLVLKLIYATFLSAKILEVAIYRYVQPDFTGQAKEPDTPPSPLIKQPLPRISYFQQLYNSWLTDFGLNMALGLLLGGTTISDTDVVMIAPIIFQGILIGGPITGTIITFMTVPAIAKGIKASVERGEIPRRQKPNLWIGWLPKNRWLLALVLLFPIVIITTVVFYGVLAFFNFQSLNFFQFFFIRTAYMGILTKGLVPLILLLYMQPEKSKSK